jgi:hypothetical protein
LIGTVKKELLFNTRSAIFRGSSLLNQMISAMDTRPNRIQNQCNLRARLSFTSGAIPYKTIVLALTVFVTTGSGQPSHKTALLNAVATANARKAELELYVKELKTSVKPPNPAYAESQRRYLAARNLYNGLVIEVITSLAGGRRATGLTTKTSQVELKTAEFTEYASQIIFDRRRTVGELTHSTATLVDWASDPKQTLHISRKIANALLANLQWLPWADIK